jgi:GAF domain-containing protein
MDVDSDDDVPAANEGDSVMDDRATPGSSPHELGQLENELQQFVEQVARDFRADVVTLYLYDADRDRFYLPVGCGLRDEITFKTAMPRTDRLAGKILKGRMPIVADDARSHPDMAGPFTFRERVASAAGFPVFLQERTVGVFFVSYRRPHTFLDREKDNIQECLREVSAILGTAQSAKMRQALAPRAPTASIIDRSLSFIVKAACKYTNAPVALWMLEPSHNRLSIQASTGLSHGFEQSAQLSLDQEHILAEIMRTGKSQRLASLESNPRFPFQQELRNEGWESLLAVPVLLRDRTVGVLAIFGFPQHDFAASDQKLLAELAQRVSDVLIIVSNLHEVSLALAAKQELKQLLRLIVHKAAETFGADIATLYLYDQDRDEFGEAIALGVTPDFFEHPKPSKTGIAARIVRKAIPIFSDNAERDERMSKGFIARQGVKSSAGCPLIVGDQVVGVLFINFRTPHRFLQSDQELLALYAGQAAAAIMNAELFEAEQRRSTMAQIANTFAETFDRQKTLQAVVEGAQKLTGACSSSLFLFAQAKGRKGLFELSARSPRREDAEGQLPRSTRGLSRLIFDTGQPVLMADTRQPLYLGDTGQEIRMRASVIRQGTLSILGVPVQIKGEPVGVLYVNSKRVNHFHERDKELLQRLGDYGAVAIERTRLLDAITEVNRATGEILHLDDLIKELLGKIVNDLQFEFAALQLVNWEQRSIETVDGINAPWGAEAKHALDSSDIQAAIVRSRHTEIISGFDPRFDKAIYDRYAHERLVRIFVPIIARGTVLGTIEAGHDGRSRPHVSMEEREALEALIRAYAQRLWRATLPCVLEVVIVNAVRMVRAHSGSIHLLWDKDGKQYIYQACAGRIGPEFLRAFPPREHGIGERSLKEKHSRLVDVPEELAETHPNIYRPQILWEKHPDKYREGEGVRAIASLPLVTGGKYEGVFYIHFWEPHTFTDDEISWLELFAEQVSMVIQNAQFYEKLRDRNRALTSLSMIGESVVGELELDALLTQIAQGAVDVLKADIVTIYQYYQDRDEFVTPPTMKGKDIKLSFMQSAVADVDAPSVIVRKLRRSRYAADARQDEVMCNRGVGRAAGRQPFVDREGVESSAGILLQWHQEVVGVMFVNYRVRRDFTDTERRIIESFASYAAVAIRSARQVISRSVLQFEAIQEIDKEISSTLDLDRVLHLILEKSMEHLRIIDGYGTLQLYDERSQMLILRAHKNVPAHKLIHRLPIDAPCVTTHAARSQEVVLVANTSTEPEYAELMPDVRSELAVPLVHEGRLVGVLNLESSALHAFDEAAVKFLTLLASQAVVAIQNAQYVQQLGQLRTVLATMISETNLETVLIKIAESALAILGADDVVIFPYNPDENEFLNLVVHRGQSQADLRPGKPKKGGLAYTVIDAGMLVIDDLTDLPAEPPILLGGGLILELNIQAFVGIALRVKEDNHDRVLGVLYVDYSRPHRFTELERQLIQALAAQAAIAIHRLRRDELRRRAEALAAINSFGASFAHRVKNLLGTLPKVFPKVLQAAEREDKEALFEWLALMQADIEKLDQILHAADSVKAYRKGELRAVDVNELVKDRMSSTAIPEGIRPVMDLAPGLPPLVTDAQAMQDMVDNLTHNALKAMPDGGELTITSRMSHDDRSIILRIKDSGVGMSAGVRDRIWEAFYSSDSNSLGLGLWLVQRAAMELGWTIDVTTEPGTGTEFTIELPIDHGGGNGRPADTNIGC